MSNKEFITNWNNIMDFKIFEQDLVRVTEMFVYNALKSLLKKFEINIAKVMETNLIDDPVNFDRIKFCKYIDHLYKLSDDRNSFLYIDLILPQPKKIMHLLETLLNFLLYYNMVKNDVIETTTIKLNEYEEILKMKNKFQIDNEHLKTNAAMMIQQNESNQLILTNLIDDKLKLTENVETTEMELNQLQLDNKSLDSKLIDLQFKEIHLKSMLVDDNEVDRLLESIQSNDKQLIELHDVEEFSIKSNQETTNDIRHLEKSIKQLELIVDGNQIDELIATNQAGKQLDMLKNELQQKKSDIIKINEAIDEQQKLSKVLRIELLEKQKHLKDVNNMNVIADAQSESSKMIACNQKLHKKLMKLNVEMENQELLKNVIIENGKKIITNLLLHKN